MFNCRLASCCLDCENSHIDIHNEIARKPGSVLMTTLGTTLYCRHMGVCSKYLESDLGDQIVLVPVNALSELDEPNISNIDVFNNEELYNTEVGDGINE